MSQSTGDRQVIPLDENFFCDGHYYVLTSASLGGSGRSPAEVSEILGQGDADGITGLLWEGVCLPLCFDGDCALDQKTLIVVGDLTPEEARDWIGRLRWKLNIPCGKLVILCGGGDADEFAEAVSGVPPRPNYQIFQAIAVPPGDYLLEIYAYLSSMTVQMTLSEYDEHWNEIEHVELREWYETHQPGQEDIGYIIRLAPLQEIPPVPTLDPEMGWCGFFEFRRPPDL
ncbi:MAG TPA: hypothetical protein V6D02_07705 [Candidatus Obscuribacterales bacterium]